MATRNCSASLPRPSEKIVRSSTSSVTRVISAATSIVAPPRPSVGQRPGRTQHGGRETHDAPAREHRGQGAPLYVPLLAFGTEQTVIEPRRQHPALQRILAVIGGIIEKNAANGARLVDQNRIADRQSDPDDRFFEVLLGPTFEWIMPQRLDQRESSERLLPRRGRGRTVRTGRNQRSRRSILWKR